MKKSILSLILVLISTVMFSQQPSLITCQIDNTTPVYMSTYYMYNNSASGTKGNTLTTTYSTSVIQINLDSFYVEWGMQYYLGDVYRFYKVGNGTPIYTGTVTPSGNSFTFAAEPGKYKIVRTGFDEIMTFFTVVNTNIVIAPFYVNESISNNQINFNWIKTAGNKYEYVFDSSPTAPSVYNATLSTNQKTYSFNPSDTVSLKYFHIRSIDSCISTWYTTAPIQLHYTYSNVGLNENNKSVSNLTAYPNPAQDQINITFHSNNAFEVISIYNISGQMISTFKTETSTENTVTIDLQQYIPGVYFAQVGTSTYKFIKQ